MQTKYNQPESPAVHLGILGSWYHNIGWQKYWKLAVELSLHQRGGQGVCSLHKLRRGPSFILHPPVSSPTLPPLIMSNSLGCINALQIPTVGGRDGRFSSSNHWPSQFHAETREMNQIQRGKGQVQTTGHWFSTSLKQTLQQGVHSPDWTSERLSHCSTPTCREQGYHLLPL